MKKLGFRLKHKFFNAFREIFVHHYNSLDFRAKVLALMIAANEKPRVDNYILVKQIAQEIYEKDEDRANLLLLTTKELIDKIHTEHSLSMDALVNSIVNNVKLVPRYAKKIDIDRLRKFLEYSSDEDSYYYQLHILEFLENLKKEILEEKYQENKEK